MAESFLMKLKASGLQFVKKEATGVFCEFCEILGTLSIERPPVAPSFITQKS